MKKFIALHTYKSTPEKTWKKLGEMADDLAILFDNNMLVQVSCQAREVVGLGFGEGCRMRESAVHELEQLRRGSYSSWADRS